MTATFNFQSSLYCIYPVFYITDYFMNLIFPLHFPDVYARAHSPNARVNIIMCMPFLCSSCIREKYVLQHPYDSTL